MVLRLINVTDYERYDPDYDRIRVYPFGIIIDYRRTEYLDWCSEFLGRYDQAWTTGWLGNQQILIFKTEEDRLLFLVRWA